MEYFIRHAGSCLKVWNKIIGQEITHKDVGTGIVAGIDKTDSGVLVKVRFHPGRPPTALLGSKRNLLRVFTSLKLPKEIEKELEKRRWDLDKEEMLDRLRYIALECLIDESIHTTFDSIIDALRRMYQHRAFSEEIIQQIKEYQRQFNDRIRFANLSKTVMYPGVTTRFPLPELTERDIELVAVHWWRSANDTRDSESLIRNHGKDYHLGRLLSARSAEKAAVAFYRNYGKAVQDISIAQTGEDFDSEWRFHDLDVEGVPIDIKNSRAYKNGETRYSEYCIPQFKRDRKDQNVTIAGVFSPYLWPRDILKPTPYSRDFSVQFLGETTLARLERLSEEFNSLVEFQSDRPELDSFLPPWVFEYPDYVYTERNKALNDFQDFSKIAESTSTPIGRGLVPVAIASRTDLTTVLNQDALNDWERVFLCQLCDRIEKYGLSLPFVFLTVLAHFLDVAGSSQPDSNFDPDKYRRFLFCEDANRLWPDPNRLWDVRNRPLGIYDPLKTIDALITALGTLWTAENGLIRKFQVFKLISFNILKGKSDDQTDRLWTTLIAYCGGRLPKDGSACGKNPLVLGESELCDYLRLICPECGYCCPSCKPGIDG